MNAKAVTYVSLDLIANKILKHPLMKSINYDDIIDYAAAVIRLSKSPGATKEDSCVRVIEDHLASIPREALNVKAVEFVAQTGLQVPMVKSTNTLAKQFDKLNTKIAYGRSIQSSFDYSDQIYNDPSVAKVVKDNCAVTVYSQPTADTLKYEINGGNIVTACRDGRIRIVFDKINVDEDGIPLIVNSEALIKAIENYIKIQVFTVLFDLGEISERSLVRAEQEYTWYIGQAQTEFNGLENVDDMEAFINNHVSLFNVSTLHSDRFESASDKEYVNIL